MTRLDPADRVSFDRITGMKENGHSIDAQHLITDKRQYGRGETVTLLATLGPEPGRETRGDDFVTVAALSPDHRRAYKVVLERYTAENIVGFIHGSASHAVANGGIRRSYDFAGQPLGQRFRKLRTVEGLGLDPDGRTAEFVTIASPMAVAVRFPDGGLGVKLHLPVQGVAAEVLSRAGNQVMLTAYDGSMVVGSAVAAPARAPVTTLSVSAARITHVVLSGGKDEALLLGLCTDSRPRHVFLYRGQVPLAPDEELGQWSTWLFTQTRNGVPAGADPLVAARTLDGLSVTDNFEDGGETYNITYGFACNVDPVPDGNFEVVTV